MILTINNCRHYFVRDAAKYNLTQEEENILKSKKIGVVGFHPFSSGYSEEVEPRLNYLSNDYVKVFQFVYDKKDTEEIPFDPNHFVTASGRQRIDFRLSSKNTAKEYLELTDLPKLATSPKPNTTIPKENLKNFLRVYLEEVKHLNTKEIMGLLDFSLRGQVYLKNYDFDFWIIGFHAPKSYAYNGKAVLTFYPSFFSLGLIPFWSEDTVKSSFWIFDKKLNLIKKVEFENVYDYIVANWIFWHREDVFLIQQDLPQNLYEPDLKEFQKELVKIMKNKVE